MPSIINASSSGSGGIVQTADASGVLQLQSNGTVALTVGTTASVGIGTSTLTNKLNVAGAIQSSSTLVAVEANTVALSQESGYARLAAFGPNSSTGGTLYLYSISSNGSVQNGQIIDSLGRVTIPNQPMVSCMGAGTNGTTLAGFFAIGQATPDLNVGSCFSTSTYLFTCPVAGKYRISVSASNGDGQSHYLAPVKNGVTLSGYSLFYTQFTSGAQSVIVSCSASDTLGALSRYNTGLYSAQLSIELIA